MFLPGKYRETDQEEIFRLIRSYPFATVITRDERLESPEPYINHLPILLDGGGENRSDKKALLIGHLARANPQLHHFEQEQDTWVIFNGPNAYISPRWYRGKEHVPTWNYATVHVRGKSRLVSDARLLEILEASTSVFERGRPNPWSFSDNPDLSAEFRAKLTGAIAGFEIRIEHVDAKFKLGQNRESADFEGALEGLATQPDEMSRAVRELMSKRKP